MVLADGGRRPDGANDEQRQAPASCALSGRHRDARQDYFELGEPAWLGIDLNRPRMLLHDDVVSDGQAKAGAFSCGLCRKEGVEHLFPSPRAIFRRRCLVF